MVARYKDHPANAGFYVRDEPENGQLAEFARIYNRMLYTAPTKIPYLNLLPLGAGIIPDYNYHVTTWVNSVGASNLKYLSWDYYPWQFYNMAGYFQNAEYIRYIGLKNNVKLASYIDAVYAPRNTFKQHLWYNVYSYLAYGVKNLQYFTHFSANGLPTGLIDVNGNRLPAYYDVQALNAKVKQLGPTLVKLTSLGVYQGGARETGTVGIPSNYYIQPASNYNFILSEFKHTNGRRYLMVVNRQLTENATYSLTFNPKPSSVMEVSQITGAEVALESPSSYNATTGVLTLGTFQPGEGRLYALPSGFDPILNIAKNRAVTSSSSYEADGWGMTKMVDGQTTTGGTSSGWTSNSNLTQNHTEWVTIDLGEVHMVNQIKMYPRSDSGQAGYGFPIDFNVHVSRNGVDWTFVVSKSGYANPGAAVQTFNFSREPARYIKIQGTSLRPNPYDGNLYRMQFAEIEASHVKLDSPSSGLLSDDFSGDLTKWVYSDYCSINNGALQVTNNESIRKSNGGYDWTNYNFQADVKITKLAAGMVFRSMDNNNCYMWQLDPVNNRLRPHKKVNGIWTVIKEVNNIGIQLNDTYTVKIEANGSTIKTYINGVLKDTTVDTTFTRGNVGFRTHSTNEEAIIDNVSVTGF